MLSTNKEKAPQVEELFCNQWSSNGFYRIPFAGLSGASGRRA
jgi:hypothetical protein